MHAYVNCVSGDLSFHTPNACEDIRGGLFCDDPGLGKTVTALALITNSLGLVPAPPKGAKIRHGSFRQSYRELFGKFYMAPLTELLEEAGINAESAAGGSEGGIRGGSQSGEGADPATPKRRTSGRARSSIVVLPNNSKARAAAQQGIKRQVRNLKVLEDLKLTPTAVGDTGMHSSKYSGALPRSDQNADNDASGLGFVKEINDFTGEQPRNVKHFNDLILSFCHQHDVTPDAIHSLPAVEVLLGRLQSHSHTTAHSASRSTAPAPRPSSNPKIRPSDGTSIVHASEGSTREGAESPVATPTDRTCLRCCASHAVRVPLVKYQLVQWAQTHLPTATQRTFLPHNSPAKPASMSEAAANAGTSYTQNFLSALGLTPSESISVSSTASPAKKHPDDDDSYIPRKKSVSSTHRNSPSGGSGGGSYQPTIAATSFSFPAAIQRDTSLRFDAPALVRAFSEASVENRRNAASEPVMLSPATLIVVPAILVEHWKHEIAKHVKHALLRVYCIEDARSADIPAHHLAWDYDVVLTTFSHLSAYGATWQLRSREARHVILQVWLLFSATVT